MINSNKKFDAVKMMRDIRNKLRDEYEKNPGKRKEDLEKVRQKYIKSKKTNQEQKV